MLLLRSLAVLLAGNLLFGTVIAHAQSTGLSTPRFHERLTGTLLTVLLHETAHAMIDVLDPVVTGPEEDIADEFAVMILLEEAERGREEALDMVEAYAATFLGLWERATASLSDGNDQSGTGDVRNVIPLDWFVSEHSFELKRAINTLCLLFGADQQRAAEMAAQAGLPIDQDWMTRCLEDYKRKRSVWKRVLEPFKPEQTQSGIVLPEGLFSGDKSPDIALAPQTPEGRPHFRLDFQENQVSETRYYDIGRYLVDAFDEALAVVSSRVALPHDITVFVRNCGAPDAYYNPNEQYIMLCHEFVDFIADDIVRYDTGLDYTSWWLRQRPFETHDGIVGRWRNVDLFGSLSGPIGTELELDDNGIATIRHLDMNDLGTEVLKSEIQFITQWGTGRPSFDPAHDWIWFLEPGFNGLFWSRLVRLADNELDLDGFKAGSYHRKE